MQAAAPVDLSSDEALQLALFLDARSIEPRLATDFACAGIEDAGWEGDPSPSILKRLAERIGKPVFPATDCRRDDATSRVVATGASGEGTWLTIGSVQCDRPDRCTASVSYYVANQGAGGRDVVATRRDGRWIVSSTGRAWIS